MRRDVARAPARGDLPAEFSALIEDIRTHGLREPITLLDGAILDGKHRYQACQEAGVEPQFHEWDGTGSPLDFVLSMNLRRRHLSESQRAMVAARIANMERTDTLRQGARSADLPNGAMSQPEAAALLNISDRLLRDAKAVQRRGIPELVALVDQDALAVSEAAKIADLTPEKQQAVLAKVAEGRSPVQARREVYFADRPAPPFPTGTFGIIYADPPWQYEQSASDGRAPEDHYPTLSLEAICALPVATIAAPDCVLFLWTPAPKVEEALQAVRAWGFVYRTHMVWDKEVFGMGYYWRQQHEDLLLAVRGAPSTPPPAQRPPSILRSRRRGHSEKPVEIYGIIEAMYPDFPKVELFARQQRPGWTAWGDEVAVVGNGDGTRKDALERSVERDGRDPDHERQ